MYKDILVPLGHAPADDVAIDTAAALARGTAEARVDALVIVPLFLPPPMEWGMIPADFYEEIHAAARRLGVERAAALRARCANREERVDVRVVETQLVPPARVAAAHARHADLAVIGVPDDEVGRQQADAVFTELLLDSGRPVLRVPPSFRAATFAPRRVAVAWRATREAARAVHDALPLLRAAEAVEIVVVDKASDDSDAQRASAEHLATHLSHHGCRAEVVHRPRLGESAGDVFLRHAELTVAELIVAGGFGHARVREQWLGGFTRTLCDRARVPVLFSH